MKRVIGVAATFVFAFFLAAQAAGQETTLRFATTTSPQAHLNVQFLHPWAKRINEQSAGVLKIDVRDGPTFVNPGNYFERTMSGVTHIAWGTQGILGHKFRKAGVVELPFVAGPSERSSLAYWRLYASGLLDDEYADVVPLILNVFPQSGLHFAKEPAALDSFRGLKVIAGGSMGSRIVEALGGTPLSLRIDEAYEALQRGTSDAYRIMYTAFQPFKLAEVTSFHIDADLGTAGGWVFMPKKVFDGLRKEQRDLLLQNSGEKASHEYGRFWDSVERAGRDDVSQNPKHRIITLSPAQSASWKKKMDAVVGEWVKTTPDGERVLAAFKMELEKAAAEK